MRFDDSLRTVLAADVTTAFGRRAAYRQLVDLIARGRVAPEPAIVARLRALRDAVPADVRASAARSVAQGEPPAALVALFADDMPSIGSTVLRGVSLNVEGWIGLLPALGPAGRATLRHRRDLPVEVRRALESFGATDFALSYDAPPVAAGDPPAPVAFPATPPRGEGPFSPVGAVADALPFLIEARRRMAESAATSPAAQPGGFRIADLVDRIAAFQQDRQVERPAPDEGEPAVSFGFETDAAGTIRTIDAAPRGAVVGLSIAAVAGVTGGDGAVVGVDGVAAGAFARRTRFTDARLSIGGASPLAGEWRISGVPLFDRHSGRFTGFRGAARRPRADQTAVRPAAGGAHAEGLRRLVHELRTPTNAIAGFSELIESELRGPVAPAYRERATAIRGLAADLTAAIEDLDLAARIEGDALALRPRDVAIVPVLRRAVADLAPLARLRDASLAIEADDLTPVVGCDVAAIERLFARLAATLLSAAQPGERITITVTREAAETIGISFARPRTLVAIADGDLLRLDAEREADLPGAPLLGTGFALRLVRNLAAELGGSLQIAPESLTVRLPAASLADMGQASIN